MNNINELYHYGVLGMKWGVHKTNSNSNQKSDLKTKINKGKAFIESKIDTKKTLKAITIGTSVVTGSMWMAKALTTGDPLSLAKAGVSAGKIVYAVTSKNS